MRMVKFLSPSAKKNNKKKTIKAEIIKIEKFDEDLAK